MLELNNVHVSYGNIKAVKGINLYIEKGEIVTLIGSNGAGKTTTMKTICGLIKPTEGKIQFKSENITNKNTNHIVKMGISMSPEGRQVFPRMTVLENLEMGSFIRTKEEEKEGLEKVFTLFPRLKERTKQIAGTLSGGEQQMLAIGRAMMAKPQLLLLDEPSLGLAPIIVQNIFELIKAINKMGTTILLVEQNARMALMIADRGYVLETGKIALSDTAKNLLDSDMVRQAYLGEVSC
ncbi:ATP-binding cassette domain-containing protein [Clostridium pascui]|uniref:ATP-binding cassette domain-containing protein n=1 Tax=Clostridium pascui TaxID=46609 RepID=UPI00195BF28D